MKAAGGNEYALAINNSGVVRATGVSKRGGRVLLTAGGKVKNSGRVRATKRVRIKSRKKIRNTGVVQAKQEIIFEAPEIEIAAGSLLDVSGALGGGSVFVGGGYQGTNTDWDGNIIDIEENAANVVIEAGAEINASATESGDAGQIVIWSRKVVDADGLVSVPIEQLCRSLK